MIRKDTSETPALLEVLHRRALLYRVQEEHVIDERDRCRPSELVQRKLQVVLPSSHIPVSSLHAQRLTRR